MSRSGAYSFRKLDSDELSSEIYRYEHNPGPIQNRNCSTSSEYVFYSEKNGDDANRLGELRGTVMYDLLRSLAEAQGETLVFDSPEETKPHKPIRSTHKGTFSSTLSVENRLAEGEKPLLSQVYTEGQIGLSNGYTGGYGDNSIDDLGVDIDNNMPSLTTTIHQRGSASEVPEYLRGSASITPVHFQERISVGSTDDYIERNSASFCEIVPGKRFVSSVNFEPTLTPIEFQDKLFCYVNSSRKRFKSAVEYEPRVRPRSFADRMYVYPKRPVHTFVSTLDNNSSLGRKWFKTAVQLQAKTFTTTKLVNVTSLNYNGTTVNRDHHINDNDIDNGDKIINFKVKKDITTDSNGNTTYRAAVVNGYANGIH
ncbi:unnamed protein product [Owenia fusiformis]|uniref:Uncharacterized protein n=1 Tax=Owenia fusiformis TaxID=6347 RepID=A0A8S4Q215_OWEFU|nr:unnamed protein product [Owenia fusiformis]